MNNLTSNIVATREVTYCFACGSKGTSFYTDLKDRLFNVPGSWGIFRCENIGCRCTWLNPMPIDNEIWKLYKNYYTHSNFTEKTGLLEKISKVLNRGYLATKYGYFVNNTPKWVKIISFLIYLHPGRRSVWDSQVFYSESKSDGRVLEVGCGSGKSLKFLINLGWTAEGLDFDAAAVQNARKKGLKIYQGDLAFHKLPAQSYDLIVMSHVIEHVPDPSALLHECYRLLKPGGRLVSLTPNSNSVLCKVFGSNWMSFDPPRHLHLFTLNALSRIASEAGFCKVRCTSTAKAVRGTFYGSRLLSKNGKLDLLSDSAPNTLVRLCGEVLEMFVSLILIFKKDIGEELVLIAKK
jgi:2-polyprenyl-3-methyl-5-hydroxy-6-metoxy-1,4-benzoquinol methylase